MKTLRHLSEPMAVGGVGAAGSCGVVSRDLQPRRHVGLEADGRCDRAVDGGACSQDHLLVQKRSQPKLESGRGRACHHRRACALPSRAGRSPHPSVAPRHRHCTGRAALSCQGIPACRTTSGCAAAVRSGALRACRHRSPSPATATRATARGSCPLPPRSSSQTTQKAASVRAAV